jgi:hypothetical protein
MNKISPNQIRAKISALKNCKHLNGEENASGSHKVLEISAMV